MLAWESGCCSSTGVIYLGNEMCEPPACLVLTAACSLCLRACLCHTHSVAPRVAKHAAATMLRISVWAWLVNQDIRKICEQVGEVFIRKNLPQLLCQAVYKIMRKCFTLNYSIICGILGVQRLHRAAHCAAEMNSIVALRSPAQTSSSLHDHQAKQDKQAADIAMLRHSIKLNSWKTQ